jgi:hypothetical protein
MIMDILVSPDGINIPHATRAVSIARGIYAHTG